MRCTLVFLALCGIAQDFVFFQRKKCHKKKNLNPLILYWLTSKKKGKNIAIATMNLCGCFTKHLQHTFTMLAAIVAAFNFKNIFCFLFLSNHSIPFHSSTKLVIIIIYRKRDSNDVWSTYTF